MDLPRFATRDDAMRPGAGAPPTPEARGEGSRELADSDVATRVEFAEAVDSVGTNFCATTLDVLEVDIDLAFGLG